MPSWAIIWSGVHLYLEKRKKRKWGEGVNPRREETQGLCEIMAEGNFRLPGRKPAGLWQGTCSPLVACLADWPLTLKPGLVHLIVWSLLWPDHTRAHICSSSIENYPWNTRVSLPPVTEMETPESVLGGSQLKIDNFRSKKTHYSPWHCVKV